MRSLLAWLMAGLSLGLTLSLAVSPGGLPFAAGVAGGLGLIAAWPMLQARRRRRLDERHDVVAATRPLAWDSTMIREAHRHGPLPQ